MMTAVLFYLLAGVAVAYGNDSLVLRDHTDGMERFNYAVRTMLAWPTYILEDFCLWLSMEDDDED